MEELKKILEKLKNAELEEETKYNLMKHILIVYQYIKEFEIKL